MFAALAASPAHAQRVVGCDCYCGINLPPPCSEQACINSCGGSSGAGYEPRPMNIAWGGMTNRISNMIEECGPKPACKVFRATFGYPLALMFDGPFYAVKGVGYGLYYGAKGLGIGAAAVGRGVGHAVSAPFRAGRAKTASLAYAGAAGCSSSNAAGFDPYREWEACKKAVLRRQKALSKLDPANKANERWCKTHLPLDSGPNRFAWEGRCNPGVTARLVEPHYLSDPLGSASPVTTASLPAARPKAPLVQLPTDVPAPQSTASDPEPKTPPAKARPRGPVLRDPDQAAEGGLESLKAASASGVDTAGALLAKQPGAPPPVVAPSAEIAAIRRGSPDPTGLSQSAAAPRGAASARTAAAAAVRDAEPVATPAATAPSATATGTPDIPATGSPAATDPAVPAKPRSLKRIGDPDAYDRWFKHQTGQTCAIMSAVQLLGSLGIEADEDALFWDALRHGDFVTNFLCDIPLPGDKCGIYNEPAGSRTCILVSDEGRATPPHEALCDKARELGGTTLDGIANILSRHAGRPAHNGFLIASEEKREAALPAARAELLELLALGRPVLMTVGLSAFYGDGDPERMHTILVTGATLMPNGDVFVYHVNDSGTGEKKRLIFSGALEKAWVKDELQRVTIK